VGDENCRAVSRPVPPSGLLGYQSTSFHDALAMRDLLGRRPAPEFEAWLARQGLIDDAARIRPRAMPGRFRALLPA
jgi:ethanolamine ammonia-lyase large subunit